MRVSGSGLEKAIPCPGILPPMYPEWLGNRTFTERHGCRFPYVSGAMANGIATTDLVEVIVQMGGMGFFGAAGLSVERVSAALTVCRPFFQSLCLGAAT